MQRPRSRAGPASVDGQCPGRAGCDTIAAAGDAARWVDFGAAAEQGREDGVLGRIGSGAVPLPGAGQQRFEHGRSPAYKSWPQYDRLKLLLQSGKSRIAWSRMAMASANQLRNDGSTIRYCAKRPGASVTCDVNNFAAPAFDKRQDDGIRHQGRYRPARRPSAGVVERFVQERERILDLTPALHRTGEDIAVARRSPLAAVDAADNGSGKSRRASRSTPLARAAGPTAPRSRGGFLRQDRGGLEARPQRRRFPHQLHGIAHVALGRGEPPPQFGDDARVPASCATPPGRTQPRPSRLPHNSAVRLSASPRSRPQ